MMVILEKTSYGKGRTTWQSLRFKVSRRSSGKRGNQSE